MNSDLFLHTDSGDVKGGIGSGEKKSGEKLRKRIAATLAVFVLWSGSPVFSQQQVTSKTVLPYKKFQILPEKGALGRSYLVTIVGNSCATAELKDAEIIPPSGITIADQMITSDCSMTARISIPEDTPLGETVFLIKKQADDGRSEPLIGSIPFEITPVMPGPIPPGLEPGVDLMWTVMPKDVVHHNFGHKIANNYYGIQLVLGNNSGYDLQIAGVGFQFPRDEKTFAFAGNTQDPAAAGGQSTKPSTDTSKNQTLKKGDNPELDKKEKEGEKQREKRKITPTNSYRATRGSLERAQELGRRVKLIAAVKSVGLLFSAFLPFWKAPIPRANAATFADILNGPFDQAIHEFFPDTTVRQLVRLDDQMLRDGIIIKNNSQIRTLVFMPKDLLGITTLSAKADPLNFRKNDTSIKDWRNDPTYVNQRLGEIELVGQYVQYLNRVQVIKTADDGSVQPPPTLFDTEFKMEQGEEKQLTLQGNSLKNPKIPEMTGLTFDNYVLDSNGRVFQVRLRVDKDLAPGPYSVPVTTATGHVIFKLYVEKGTPTLISTKPKPESVTANDTVQNISLVIEGKFLKGCKIKIKTEKDIFEIKDDAKSDYGKVTQTITISKKAKEGNYTLEIEDANSRVIGSVKFEIKKPAS